MEETVKQKQVSGNKKQIGLIIVSILTILVVATFVVSLTVFMMTYAQMGAPVSFGIYTSNLFATGGFGLFCMVAFILTIWIAKEKREMLSKVFVWGVLLIATMYSTTFFANWMQGVAMLNLYTTYIPWVLLVVATVAMIACWDSSDKKKLNIIEWVCLIASAVLSAISIVQAMMSLMSADALSISSLILSVAAVVAVNLFILLLALITRSKRTFDKTIFAMTDEEADIVERIETRVEEIADEVEELAAEGEAFVEAKEAVEEEQAAAAENDKADQEEK